MKISEKETWNKSKKHREWEERWRKQSKKIYCQHKHDWENASVNSIGKALFTGSNEALVNIQFWSITHYI